MVMFHVRDNEICKDDAAQLLPKEKKIIEAKIGVLAKKQYYLTHLDRVLHSSHT